MIYIDLKNPLSVSTNAVRDEITKHIKAGKKTSEITWRMNFVTTDKVVKSVSDKFQVLKNKIAFQERPKIKVTLK